MPRYAAFLRGVSPMNCQMPALKRCFEAAGYTDVRTLLSSGNVVFNARAASIDTLARRAEKAMQAELGRTFDTFVRPIEHLRALVESGPFAGYGLPSAAKPLVIFLRDPAAPALTLPIEHADASILACTGGEALAYYVPGPKGGAFMRVLERTFGKAITTRTLDTVRRCVAASCA